MTTQDELVKEAMDKMQRNSGWIIALGVLFVILGVVGLGMSVGLTMVSMYFFGLLLLLGGVVHLVDVFKSRKLKGAFWHVLLTILYLAAGMCVINEPFFASSLITILMASFFIAVGLIRIIWGFYIKDEVEGYGWIVFAGAMSLLLGILVMMQWPASGFWFLGLMIAVEMIVTGWTYVFMGVAIKRA